MNAGFYRGGRLFLLALAISWSLFKMEAQITDANPMNALVSANNGFGLHLLSQLVRENPRANVFIAPQSIATVLQVLLNGARSRTAAELQQVLGTSNLSLEDMNLAAENLAERLASSQTNVALNIANALWYRRGVEVKEGFKNANTRFFHATLSALDFDNPQCVQIMNDWAAKNTSGRIKGIIEPPIEPTTSMIIANAIYFKGNWLNQFDSKQTRPRPFHCPDGRDKQAPMMQQSRIFSYREGNAFQAVQLPYFGRELQMQVLLPATNSSVEALLAQIAMDSGRRTFLSGFNDRHGTLMLPRFTMHYSAELVPSLSALGIRSAFNPQQADFSAISSLQLYVSKVKHQSFVEVNEQGTEAAAVTTGIVALTSAQPMGPPPFQMVVDRPFLFVISERQTRSILFIGVAFEPASAGE